jgi:YfiH family protein
MVMTEPKPNRGFAWTQAPWGRVLRCLPLAAMTDHFFTARDIVLRESDDEWNAVALEIGVGREDLLLIRQVHEASVAIASTDRPRPWPRPAADAIVSNDPGCAVAVRVADCVPVLLAEESGRAVAAIHAGWRGIASRAIIAGVETLQARWGVRPERLTAAVGPCIGPCCYEVGDDTREAFRRAGHHASVIERWFEPRSGGRYHLDLWRAASEQLEGAGLAPGSIHLAGLCTRTHAGALHSYRVDGDKAGRMAAVIRAAG